MKNMDITNYIKGLIEKYDKAQTTLVEEQKLYAYFNQEEIADELTEYRADFKVFAQDFMQLKTSDDLVENTLSLIRASSVHENRQAGVFSINRSLLLAASIVLLMLSFILGYFTRANQESLIADGTKDIQTLKYEVLTMKELMVQNFLDQKQNHQKLYALTLASQMDSLNGEILDKVFTALKHDENINIRLAAADMLYQFANYASVQEGLIEVFPKQESPLVILELLRLIKSLDQETSKKLLDKVLDQENLKDSLRTQIVNTYQAI